jgi:diguanylate cyclase (GGDEF)-like protein
MPVTDELGSDLSADQQRQNRYNIAVVFLDLDHFNLINDTFGHSAGVRLLQQVSRRFKQTARAADTVGRLGGDEFALVLSELAERRDAETTVQKLLEVLQEPFDLNGHEVFVTASPVSLSSRLTVNSRIS